MNKIVHCVSHSTMTLSDCAISTFRRMPGELWSYNIQEETQHLFQSRHPSSYFENIKQ